jgi:hypothetical protein
MAISGVAIHSGAEGTTRVLGQVAQCYESAMK